MRSMKRLLTTKAPSRCTSRDGPGADTHGARQSQHRLDAEAQRAGETAQPREAPLAQVQVSARRAAAATENVLDQAKLLGINVTAGGSEGDAEPGRTRKTRDRHRRFRTRSKCSTASSTARSRARSA